MIWPRLRAPGLRLLRTAPIFSLLLPGGAGTAAVPRPDSNRLAPRVAVLPHHATLSGRWNAEHMLAALPSGVTLVGIDEATALLLPEGRVLGAGRVTVYGGEGVRAYGEGEIAPV